MSCFSRDCAVCACVSRLFSTFCASLRICPSRSASCELSARMRGWLSSKVVDRSAMSAFSCTWRSRSRWISSDDSTSGSASSEAPLLQRGAHAVGGRFRGSPVGAHPRQFGRQLGQLLRGEHRIVLADQQVRLRAEGGDLRLGILDPLAEVGDLRSPASRSRRHSNCSLALRLHREIGVGDGVRDLGGKLRDPPRRTR